ncbi:MAG: Ppx/GppA family phosphatase [Phycisphaerae bacterium]|nr:Ppx/GppA family phosphatase [Phycisphaerae bacterium]
MAPAKPKSFTTRPATIAAIDIGSNAVRFALARVDSKRNLQIIEERRRPTRLGANLASGKPLPRTGVKATIAAVKEFCFDAMRHGTSATRLVATAAVRESPDGPAFVRRLTGEVGLPVEIIGPDEEARLAFASCRASFDLRRGHVAIVDIGGGSVQVSFANRGILYESVSMPLGAVRLTSMFSSESAGARKDPFARMKKHIHNTIRDRLPIGNLQPAAIIGCGGTFATIGTLLGDFAGQRSLAPVLARGARSVARSGHAARDLIDLVASVEKLDASKRAEMLRKSDIPADRADILPAGLIVARALVRHLGVKSFVAHAGGVRDGLLREMAGPAEPGGIIEQAHALARVGDEDRAHSEHVAHLAVALLHDLADADRVREILSDRPDATELLESAALLHDLGVPIDYERHHKISRRIIELAHWPGTDPLLRAMIANIARYHRKSLPTERHAPYAALPARARQVVRVLAGVLRIADGLDRSHTQTTSGIRVRIDRTAVEIAAEGVRAGSPNFRAAFKKSDLLAAVIRRTITVIPG